MVKRKLCRHVPHGAVAESRRLAVRLRHAKVTEAYSSIRIIQNVQGLMSRWTMIFERRYSTPSESTLRTSASAIQASSQFLEESAGMKARDQVQTHHVLMLKSACQEVLDSHCRLLKLRLPNPELLQHVRTEKPTEHKPNSLL